MTDLALTQTALPRWLGALAERLLQPIQKPQEWINPHTIHLRHTGHGWAVAVTQETPRGRHLILDQPCDTLNAAEVVSLHLSDMFDGAAVMMY